MLSRDAVRQAMPALFEQYDYLEREWGIAYPRPALEALRDPVPVWDSETLKSIVLMANDLGCRLIQKENRIKKLKAAARQAPATAET